MTTLISLALLGSTLTGSITYYSDGLMELVYRNRLAWGHVQPCPECMGFVALLDRENVGKRVYLQRPGHAPEGPFLSIDCSDAKDLARHRRNGKVAEVDYQTARRWHMAGPLYGVRVLFEEEEGKLHGSHPRRALGAAPQD